MANRFKNTLYTITKHKRINGQLRLVSNEDRTLFSGDFKTKIRPEDLPEWYLYGRYYKRWGFMSTKGIVDMVYRPNMRFNHFLKDDFLYISYKNKIEKVTEEDKLQRLLRFEHYKGYDEVVFGNEIIEILKGAREYSNYDITPIVEQIREKLKWLREVYPEEFGEEVWGYDLDEDFAEGISDFAKRKEHHGFW